MKLPIPSFFGKKSPSNYYLALLLRDEKTVAVVLEEVQGKLNIIGKGEMSFSTQLEDVPMEELFETLDKAISKAEEALPPNIETEQTVFGVKDSWVDEKKIKKEYLSKLKKVCDTLTLQPIGFMVISEAVSHLLAEEEGAPLSAILAEIGKQQVTLTLFRANRILEAHSSRIEDSIPHTVDRLLHHFTTDVLPSRIIIFNGGGGEELAQKFIAHHWSKSIPFLHVPQISVLPEGFDGKAMVYGAAEQMGFSVLEALGNISVVNLNTAGEATKHETPQQEEKEEIHEKAALHHKKSEGEEEKEQSTGETEEEKLTEKDSEIDETPVLGGENFGFVMGGDIAAVKPHRATEHKTEETMENAKPTHGLHETPPSHHSLPPRPSRLADEDSNEEEDGESGGFSLGGVFSFIPGVFASLLALNPLKGGVGMGFSRKMLLIPLVLLIILGIGAFYLFSLKATVTLQMQAKKIDETTDITLRTDSSNDLSQRILSAQKVETSVEGSVSTDATGKKDVGDKAKGTVTLYNSSTDGKKTVPEGTVITSSNDLDFVTDKEVVVASASGDIFSGIKSGTSQVNVTAKSIGTEYNLPSNTKFTVNGTSSLAGKNDSAFSGGSKKTVTVIAKKDIDTLTANLPKGLEEQAKTELKAKASSDQALLPLFTDTTISKKTTDNDIGDEAKKVTMKGTVTFTTLAYSADNLKQLAEASLKGKYTEDLAISDKGIEASLEDIKIEKNNDVSATLKMTAGLLPKIEKDTIVKELSGKSFNAAEEYLKTIPQVQSAEIVLSPNLPFLPKLLPRFSKNITVVLETNE